MLGDFKESMEAFMEDTDIEVKVEVNAPAETATEVEETTTEATEVEDTAEEVEENDEEAQMYITFYRRLYTFKDYLSKYGCNRSFLSMVNSDGEFSSMLGMDMPSCESLSHTGSPSSDISQSCLSALNQRLATQDKFLRSFHRRATERLIAFQEAVDKRCRTMLRNIARISKRMYEIKQDYRTDDKKADTKIFSLESLDRICVTYPAKLLDVVDKEISLLSKIAITENASPEVRQAASVHKVMSDCLSMASKYNENKRQAKKERISLKDLSVRDTATMLNRATNLIKRVQKNVKALSMISKMTKTYQNGSHMKMNESILNSMSPVKPLALASETSYLTIFPVKLMKNDLKLANLYLRTAGQRISAIKNS